MYKLLAVSALVASATAIICDDAGDKTTAFFAPDRCDRAADQVMSLIDTSAFIHPTIATLQCWDDNNEGYKGSGTLTFYEGAYTCQTLRN